MQDNAIYRWAKNIWRRVNLATLRCWYCRKYVLETCWWPPFYIKSSSNSSLALAYLGLSGHWICDAEGFFGACVCSVGSLISWPGVLADMAQSDNTVAWSVSMFIGWESIITRKRDKFIAVENVNIGSSGGINSATNGHINGSYLAIPIGSSSITLLWDWVFKSSTGTCRRPCTPSIFRPLPIRNVHSHTVCLDWSEFNVSCRISTIRIHHIGGKSIRITPTGVC